MPIWKSLLVTVLLGAVLLGAVAVFPHDLRVGAFIGACVLFVIGLRVFKVFAPSRPNS